MSARTHMRNNVCLIDGRFGWQAKSCPEQSCQCKRDRIDAITLLSVRTQERGQAILAGAAAK